MVGGGAAALRAALRCLGASVPMSCVGGRGEPGARRAAASSLLLLCLPPARPLACPHANAGAVGEGMGRSLKSQKEEGGVSSQGRAGPQTTFCSQPCTSHKGWSGRRVA